MKTLQNDLTTIEQSKRLLELGVPKNSANNYYGKDGKLHYIDGTIPYSLLWETGCTPCWSVGRLMEIYDLCTGKVATNVMYCEEEYVLGIITAIEAAVKYNYIDFSKLEE